VLCYMLLVTLSDRGNLLTYSCSHPPGEALPLGLNPHTIARVACPRPSLCNRLLEFSVDSTKFISWPVTLDAAHNAHLTQFSVLAALPLDAFERHAMARAVLPPLCAALLHEQRHRRFMSDQVAVLLRARDQHDPKQLKSSSLSRTLTEICQALATNTLRNVRVNDWIQVGVSDGVVPAPDTLRPYRTVLLLEDADNLLAQLPDDASSSLRRLIRLANPMKSFRDLSVDLGMPLAHIFRLCAHLVHWRKARIMSTLTKHSILTINSEAVLDRAICDAFEAAFPTHGLPDQLSRFAVPKRLDEHLRVLGQGAQHQLINLVIFLLRHSLLVLLHTFVSLIPDHGALPALPFVSSSSYPSSVESAGSYRLLSSSPQVGVEFAGKISKTKKLYNRLLQYFNGEHHIEEIMWAENVSRQEIAAVLGDFHDRLCTYYHQGI